MSILSDKLSYYLSKKSINMSDLSRRCKIERSTLYQYINGKRPLQNLDHLKNIMLELHLSPDEKVDILEAYQIGKIGIEKYKRREKVKKIISSLITNKNDLPDDIANINILENEKEDFSCKKEEIDLVQGEIEIASVLRRVFWQAATDDEDICLLVQPDNRILMETLMTVCHSHNKINVKHIICLESDNGHEDCANLDMIPKILRYGVGIYNYKPFYYYGNPKEHYGIISTMPCLIFTNKYAVQMSADQKTALLTRSPEVSHYFNVRFHQIIEHCHPLMVSIDNALEKWTAFMKNYIYSLDFSNTYEMSSGICSIQFWDKEMIKRYINKNLQDCEELADVVSEYVELLNHKKQKGNISVLMSRSSAEKFIKTGVFKEYPEDFFSEALTLADRKTIINRTVKAVSEGWYHIRMLPEDYIIPDCWEIIVNQGERVIFQYSFDNHFRLLICEEEDIVEAIYDYFLSFSEREDMVDETEACALLEKWRDEYLQ